MATQKQIREEKALEKTVHQAESIANVIKMQDAEGFQAEGSAPPAGLEEAQHAVETGMCGVCRFCGQLVNVGKIDPNFEGGADEWASQNCGCAEAQQYKYEVRRAQERKNDLERAEKRITDLFGAGAKVYGMEPVEDEILNLIYTSAVLVYDVKMKEVTIAASSEIKAKICRTAKGKLQLARSDATTTKQEV